MTKTESKNRFNARAFVALVVVTSGIGLPLTGLMNHLHQTEPIALKRHAWMSAHSSLGVIFAVLVVWHVALNRRSLLNHIRGLRGRLPVISREATWAGAVVAILVLAAVGHAFIAR